MPRSKIKQKVGGWGGWGGGVIILKRVSKGKQDLGGH